MNVTRIKVGALDTNCYLCRDEATGRCALIDPGEMEPALRDAIREAGQDAFDYILLTHCHFDHIGGVAEAKALTGAPVAIYQDDAPGLQDPLYSLFSLFTSRPQAPVQADVTFADGDRFYVGQTAFTVLHTPGHTKGSCCYLTEGKLFSGDTLFCESAGRTDFPGSSTADLRASLQKLMALPGDFTVYPGHDEFTSLSHERACNPYVAYFNQNKS